MHKIHTHLPLASSLLPPLPSNPSFRSGDVPKVVAYIDKAFLKTKWFVAHVRDIQEGHCPLPCTITTQLSEVTASPEDYTGFESGDCWSLVFGYIVCYG